MANRDSSKQKRARQNRAQREALKARTAAASTPPAERQAKYASTTPKEAADGGRSKGGRGARQPVERAPRPGDVAVDVETLQGSWFSKRLQVPGGKQVLMAAALAVLVFGMTMFIDLPAQEAPKGSVKPPCSGAYVEIEKGTCGTPAESFVSRYGAVGVALLAASVLLVFVAVGLSLSPRRRRIWVWAAMFTFAAGIFLFQPSLFFVGGFLGFGAYKARKVEGPAPGSMAARAMEKAQAQAAAADDEDDLDLDDETDASVDDEDEGQVDDDAR